MASGTFATVINCMDGRTQLPLINWIKERYGVDYVDTITEPGPDRILSAGHPDDIVGSIKGRLLISVQKHASEQVVLVAHGDCAGNPVTKDEHLGMLRKGMELLRRWDLPVDIVGVWVDEINWEVEVIAEINRPKH